MEFSFATPNISAAKDWVEYNQIQIFEAGFYAEQAPKERLLRSNIRIIGKVAKTTLLHPDEIVLYRNVIDSCADGALPLGVLVKLPGKVSFKEEEWVGVEGRVTLLPFEQRLRSIKPIINMAPQGQRYPCLAATTAYRVAAPDSEYLYQ
ncbi:MAG TPA: hypothetical protein VHR47_11835 [Bacillota bacterium]|nr:hypothetical protein [Bacillota bacterium]